MGLTFQQVQKYERGANRIGAGRLLQLANILGVSISYSYDELGMNLLGTD
ncbi:MAG: helix-turn-helix transcriptional regulator, partial [Pseudomonadota bacterium]|nr:helix-turn-helix transcriptional regulator [Pseudomonadota bacterium]